jgi:hypothetical protein
MSPQYLRSASARLVRDDTATDFALLVQSLDPPYLAACLVGGCTECPGSAL